MTRRTKPKSENFLQRKQKEIVNKLVGYRNRLNDYLDKLFVPTYLIPVKLITYTLYYLLKLVLALIKTILETLFYPFLSFKNFLKSAVIIFVSGYLVLSYIVLIDYIKTQYGWWDKFVCRAGVEKKLKDSVVRVVGGFSEGSGFFLDGHTILTNFHVILGEPSPKIIFPDGSFTTAFDIKGDIEADIALLNITERHPEKILKLMLPVELYQNEPLISVGYPGGTTLAGEPTLLRGNYITMRSTRNSPVEYIHTDINVAKGMSGGPLVDNCGNVVGINTATLTGNSFFISSASYWEVKDGFSDKDVTKLYLDPSKSPEEAVRAFYTYLKVRDMESGFNLLSSEYLKNTNFKEWTDRFNDVIDVTVRKTEAVPGFLNRVFLKFSTKNWVDGEAEFHFYEGTWDTVFEDDVYKMLRANITEVEKPTYKWFWTSE